MIRAPIPDPGKPGYGPGRVAARRVAMLAVVAAALLTFTGMVSGADTPTTRPAGASAASQPEHVERFPDGAIKLRYKTNATGQKTGLCEEFYETGRLKLRVNYAAGQLHGDYASYFDSGKLHVTARYAAGLLDGPYLERTPDGEPKLQADYAEGKRHGRYAEFDKKRVVVGQLWRHGTLMYAKTDDRIVAALHELGELPGSGLVGIPPRPPAPGGRQGHDVVLRRLKVYRFLADVSYQDIALDDGYSKLAQAAAEICDKLGQLDHFPENPGMPDADYRLAARGAASSNLAAGTSLLGSIDTWIADDKPPNIANVGHRVSALNPRLAKTGFGATGRCAAMFVLDFSRRDVPAWDFVAFPPRGMMPAEFFRAAYPWSITLNGQFYAPPAQDAVKVAIRPADAEFLAAGEALALDFFSVSQNTIVFRPEKLDLKPGSRYVVNVTGLAPPGGKGAKEIQYFVEFFKLAK